MDALGTTYFFRALKVGKSEIEIYHGATPVQSTAAIKIVSTCSEIIYSDLFAASITPPTANETRRPPDLSRFVRTNNEFPASLQQQQQFSIQRT